MEEQNTNTLADELANAVEVEEPTQEVEEEAEVEEEPVADEVIIEALNHPSEAVRAVLQQLVNDAVKKVLSRNKPKRATVKADPIDKKKFSNMTYAERENLFNTNRPLYEKLKNM